MSAGLQVGDKGIALLWQRGTRYQEVPAEVVKVGRKWATIRRTVGFVNESQVDKVTGKGKPDPRYFRSNPDFETPELTAARHRREAAFERLAAHRGPGYDMSGNNQVLRWDRLTTEQAEQLADLVEGWA